jgi:transposase-like protein
MNEHLAKLAKSETVANLPLACSDEAAAVEFFEAQRWGNSPCCPHCKDKNVYKMKDRDGTRNNRYLWRCRACGEQYTVRIGTVFEETRIPLRHWAYCFWRACSSKKGVSALEIRRHCQISYKSALFLMHRIRFAMADDSPSPEKLGGTVEYDETYVGGKPRKWKHGPMKGYRNDSNKIPLVAMVERGGPVRTKVIPRVTYKNVQGFINGTIDEKALVNTDASPIFPPLFRRFAQHQTVNHGRKEYARHNPDGTVSHVNTAECFFSLIKRGLMGVYHAVSQEHLHRYCAEFAFRWDTRNVCDGDRIAAVIKRAEGKRLVYSASTKSETIKAQSQESPQAHGSETGNAQA